MKCRLLGCLMVLSAIEILGQLAAAVPAPQKPAELSVQSDKPRPLRPEELKRLRRQILDKITTDLNLAGLDKQAYPPFYNRQLGAYRSRWNRLNPDVAPFLGTWVDDYDLFPTFYTMTVLPSRIRGQMCVIEFEDYQYRGGNPVGEVIPPNPLPRLSIIRLAYGQGGGNRLRFDRRLLSRIKPNWLNQEVEVVGVVRPNNELRVYAAKTIPEIDPQLPAAIIQQLNQNQCQVNP